MFGQCISLIIKNIIIAPYFKPAMLFFFHKKTDRNADTAGKLTDSYWTAMKIIHRIFLYCSGISYAYLYPSRASDGWY